MIGISTILIGFIWFAVYRSPESLVLTASTLCATIVIGSSWSPESGFKSHDHKLRVYGITYLLVGIVWTWHATLLFAASFELVLFGNAIIMATSLYLPIKGIVEWLDYEHIWDLLAILLAVASAALITGWSILSFSLPTNGILTLGCGLSLYSLFSTPITKKAESMFLLPDNERIAHLMWIPAIPGWGLLAYAISVMYLVDPMMHLGLTCFGITASFYIYGATHPLRPRGYVIASNLGIASSLGIIIWAGTAGLGNVPLSIGLTAAIWYIVSLPILYLPTVVALERTYSYLIQHKEGTALVLPGVVGVILGVYALLGEPSILLGLSIGHCIQALFIATIISGILYLIEILVLDSRITESLKKPAVMLLSRGAFLLVISSMLPEVLPYLDVLLWIVTSSISLSLVVTVIMSHIVGLGSLAQQSHKLLGIIVFPTSILGFTIYQQVFLLSAILYAAFISFLIETPFLKQQLRAFMRVLSNLGNYILSGIRWFIAKLKYVFDRFGYIMWGIFSFGFTATLGYLTFPFFSNLIGMNPTGVLYIIPSISFPLLILGALLLTLSIARRQVMSRFGSIAMLTVLSGLGVTGMVKLLDMNQAFTALTISIACIGIAGMILVRELQLTKNWQSMFWGMIPLAGSVFLMEFLLMGSSSPIQMHLSVLLSLMVLLGAYIASTYLGLLSTKLNEPLWVVLALTSGILTLVASISTGFSILSSLYLSFFILSWVTLPVTARRMKYLFLAPLFFSLTGFAYSFVFGEFYQGLLLASAAFLLFVSQFFKERESDNPRLVWARLAVLVTLVGCLVVFGITVVLEYLPL